MGYRPKVVMARIKTGNSESLAKRMMNGLVLHLGLWKYLGAEYRLFGWGSDDDETMMEAMFLSEVEAGLTSEEYKSDFIEAWRKMEWEPEGSFIFLPDEVEVTGIVCEERDD